tara:strand:+ start:16759 stop:18087 length:1329 start_codon:yes stop_codon:yes gene_type:complete
MSIRVWLRRKVYQQITSETRLEARRAKAEKQRQRRGEPHRVMYFHRPGDPASALMSALTAALAERYDIAVELHLVGGPAADVAPDPERLVTYARQDTAALAQHFGLDFTDPGHAADPALEARALAIMTAATGTSDALQAARETDRALWSGDADAMEGAAARYGQASAANVKAACREGSALRDRLGHFQSGALYYAGEWYWTADRLHYLETRLRALGAAHADTDGFLAPPLLESQRAGDCQGAVLELYPSLRSPYTYLAMERAFALADRWNARVDLRFVLPMVMRSLPVPRRKGLYFLLDTKREATRLGLPFGDICDPVGRPTERGLAVLHHANAQGQGREFLTSFLRGVWADGLDAGSDGGLRRIAERAGIDWATVQTALGDESWRETAEANRQRLLDLGLWGVPSFHTGDLAVWGQDRLWRVEKALQSQAATPSTRTDPSA